MTALITPLAVHLFFPVIPAVKMALGLSDAYAQFTFSISLFGMAFATLFYGSLSDRYGRRPVLLSGLVLFLFGSVVSAIAPTAETLVLGRLVQAIGAGCALTLVRAIARDAFRAEQLVKAIAYLTMFGTLGPMISPIIGGVLIDTLGWRSVFGFAVLAGGAITLHRLHGDGRNPSGGQPHQERCRHRPQLRRAVQPAALQRLRAAERVQHRRVHGDGDRVGIADDRAAAPSRHRVRTLFSAVPDGLLHRQSDFDARSAIALSTETMVLIGSIMALAAVSGQALVLSYGWVTPLAFFIPGMFITMAQGIAMPYAQVGAMAEIPRFAGTAAGVGVFMQNFCAAVFAQLYGIFADGTPRPMIMIAVLCGVLTMIAGALPILQKRFGTIPPPG